MPEENTPIKEANRPDPRQSSATKLGEMPIFKLIMTMSLPSMFSMLVQACYNVVDSIYVSRLGEYAISALSIVYPIQILTISVSVGTSVGLSSLISRRLGERNHAAAQAAANHGLYLCGFHWIIFLLFGLLGTNAFCSLYADPAADAALYFASADYCRIICVGSLFILTSNSFEKIMQAGGNMTAPMWCMLAGAITNIILDPIMIFGLLGCKAYGVAGAAYATVIGQAVTFLVSNIFMRIKKDLPVRVEYKIFKLDFRTIKDIYQVGFPSMVMQAITSVTTLVLNKILIAFSSTAVAALGIFFKLQSFVFMPVFGLNHGLMPIMGYNFGARNKKRLLQAYKYGACIAAVIMIIGMVIFNIFPDKILLLFKAEGELMHVGTQCLRIISWSFPFAAFGIITGTLFQATAKGLYSLIVSVMRQLVAIAPLAYLFSRLWGVNGTWFAYPSAEIISVIVSIILYKRLYKTKIARLDEPMVKATNN